MVESKIFSHLSTTTAITITKSISTRIYPSVVPDETKYPCISYSRVSDVREYHLSGYANLENPRIQIDVWAETYKESKDISSAIHTAMQTAPDFKAILIDDSDMYEPDALLYRVSMDFSCWNRE